jgi:hypothetical protein
VRRLLFFSLLLTCLAGLAGCGDRAADEAADAAAADEARAKAKALEDAAARREAERLRDLWTYHEVPAGKGRQLTASIYSTNDVDTDGQGARRVQLVFRDHPSWGRSSYLVLQGGDFACYGGCTVGVSVDEKPVVRMAARRPRTDEAIAMFIDDERALWRLIAGASRLAIEFPVKAGGARSTTFDVAGLDRARMPGWD